MKLSKQKIYAVLFIVFILSLQVFSKHKTTPKNPYSSIVMAWNEAHNNWRFTDLKNLYADRVLFYCNALSKQECISDKTSQISPTRIFVQKIISDITTTEFGEGFVKCNFTKEIFLDRKKSVYPAYLILQTTNNELKIVCEGDDITDKNLGYKIEPISFREKLEPLEPKTNVEAHSNKSNNFYYYFGAIIIVLLIVLIIWKRIKGSTIVEKHKEPVSDNSTSNQNNNTKVEPEVVSDNAKEGHTFDFEKFIVNKFNTDYFTLLVWQSDKKTTKVIPSANSEPDLIYEFKFQFYSRKFAVECKFRPNDSSELIDVLTPEEKKTFIQFSREKKMDVYIALGLGGNTTSPKELFLIPLDELQYNSLYYSRLTQFGRGVNQNFFFDRGKHRLT